MRAGMHVRRSSTSPRPPSNCQARLYVSNAVRQSSAEGIVDEATRQQVQLIGHLAKTGLRSLLTQQWRQDLEHASDNNITEQATNHLCYLLRINVVYEAFHGEADALGCPALVRSLSATRRGAFVEHHAACCR